MSVHFRKDLAFIISLLALLLNSFAFSQDKAVTGFADVGGSKLYYEIAGKGPAVVLIHGGLVDSRLWNGQFEKFARHFKVIRYDLRGFGRSDFSYGPYSHVADLHSLLTYLKIESASLVGLSLGGIIAADFAIEHPEMVEKLVLTSSGLRAGSKSLRNAQAAPSIRLRKSRDRPSHRDVARSPIFREREKKCRVCKTHPTDAKATISGIGTDPASYPDHLEFAANDRAAKNIKAPTLIVTVIRRAEILTVAEMLRPESRLDDARYQDTSHHLVMEKPGNITASC